MISFWIFCSFFHSRIVKLVCVQVFLLSWPWEKKTGLCGTTLPFCDDIHPKLKNIQVRHFPISLLCQNDSNNSTSSEIALGVSRNQNGVKLSAFGGKQVYNSFPTNQFLGFSLFLWCFFVGGENFRCHLRPLIPHLFYLHWFQKFGTLRSVF